MPAWADSLPKRPNSYGIQDCTKIPCNLRHGSHTRRPPCDSSQGSSQHKQGLSLCPASNTTELGWHPGLKRPSPCTGPGGHPSTEIAGLRREQLPHSIPASDSEMVIENQVAIKQGRDTFAEEHRRRRNERTVTPTAPRQFQTT